MHNGLVHDFPRVKRDLVLAIDEGLYPSVEGSTDSEVLVHLALTFGLEQDPPSAVARMVGFVAEPLGDPEGAWNEVPESSYGVIKPGDDELHPFQPVAA
jgi:glutamine amidotransferase